MKQQTLTKIERTTNFLEVLKKFLYGLIMILLFITALMFWLYVFTYSEAWKDISILMVQMLRFSGLSFAFIFILYYLFSFMYDFLYKREIKKIELRVDNGFL